MAIVATGNSAGLNVRAEKTTTSAKLGVISNGTTVQVVRCNDTWATLLYHGTPAFLMHQYLTDAPEIVGDGLAANGNAVVNMSNVNVRSGAGTAYASQSKFSKGTNVSTFARTLASDGFWYKMDPLANRWVRGDFLAPGGSGNVGGGDSGNKPGTYTAHHIGRLIKNDVNVRNDASTSAVTMGRFPVGVKFVISGVKNGATVDGSNLWVAVFFGNAKGEVLTKYIHSSCIEDQGALLPNDAKTRFVEVARSQNTLTGALLGLGGDWCQNWMYWLAAATGKKPTGLPYGQSYVSGGLAYFKRIELGAQPQVGDWVYYTKTINQQTPSHVGLVTSVNAAAGTFGTHEGNVPRKDSPMAQNLPTVVGTEENVSYINGTGVAGRHVLCFVRPTYL